MVSVKQSKILVNRLFKLMNMTNQMCRLCNRVFVSFVNLPSKTLVINIDFHGKQTPQIKSLLHFYYISEILIRPYGGSKYFGPGSGRVPLECLCILHCIFVRVWPLKGCMGYFCLWRWTAVVMLWSDSPVGPDGLLTGEERGKKGGEGGLH